MRSLLRLSGPRGRVAIAAAALSSALVLAFAPRTPLALAVAEAAHFTDNYAVTGWDCGYPMAIEGSVTATVANRTNLDGVTFFSIAIHVDERWTAQDGRWFTVRVDTVFKDLKAEPVGDNTFELTSRQTGQPFRIVDSGGRNVLKDSGAITFHALINAETGEFIDLGADVKGPHPSFEPDALCHAVQPLVGTASPDYLTARPLHTTDAAMGYYEYLPPSYTTTGAPSPLLIFTHGYGETGDGSAADLDKLFVTAIPRYLKIGGWPTDRPLVVLAPQHTEDPPFDFSGCNNDRTVYAGTDCMQYQHDLGDHPAFCTTPGEIHDFIAYAVKHYNVDPDRVYLTGLSCGAFGIWEYVAAYGDTQVAAAVPYAGNGQPAWNTAGCGLGEVPIWAFSGALDDVVNPEGSTVPITNLRACPGVDPDHARLTLYPDFFHEGWDEAYSGALGDDIYSWMLNHTRS